MTAPTLTNIHKRTQTHTLTRWEMIPCTVGCVGMHAGLESHYWLGTEAGMLHAYDFCGQVYSGDGSVRSAGCGSAAMLRHSLVTHTIHTAASIDTLSHQSACMPVRLRRVAMLVQATARVEQRLALHHDARRSGGGGGGGGGGGAEEQKRKPHCRWRG